MVETMAYRDFETWWVANDKAHKVIENQHEQLLVFNLK